MDQFPTAEFEAWFATVLRDAHQSNEVGAEKFVHAVEWALCDWERNHSSRASLRRELARLVAPDSDSDTDRLASNIVSTVPPVLVGKATVMDPVELDVNWVQAGQWLFAAAADRESSVVSASLSLHQ